MRRRLDASSRPRDRPAVRDRLFRILVAAATLAPPACLKIPDDLTENPDGTPGAPTTAAEVLDRHISALGGANKLHAIKQRTVEARMVFHKEEGCEADQEDCFAEDKIGTFVLNTTADGRLYRRTLLTDLLEERGYDGKQGWSLGADRMLRLDAPDEAIVSREDAMLHWYFDIAKRGIETSLVAPRDQDSAGRPAQLDGVRWTIDPSQPPKTMWFDRATGLLREETIDEGEGADRREQIIVYEDYKAVDGVLVSFDIRVINRLGGREQVVDFETQRISHEPIAVAKFSMPAVETPKPVADPLLAEVAKARVAALASPKDVAAQMGLTRALFEAGHFEAAEIAAQATLAIERNEPEALYTLARTQLLLGDVAAASKSLQRAVRAGVRPDAIARQQAWVHARRLDFPKLAKALDVAGGSTMAGRYRAFVGKPYTVVKGAQCVSSAKLAATSPLVMVSLDIGGKKADAILDTASAEVILAASYAKEIDVTVRARASFDDQAPEVAYGQVEQLAIGGSVIRNVPVAIIADEVVAEMSGEPAGKVRAVVGTHVLSQYLVTVDIPGSKLELVAPGPACKAARDAKRKGKDLRFYLHEAHHIYISAKMNAAEGLYLLNTGMRGADLAATQAAYSYAGIGAPALRSDEIPMVTVARFAMQSGGAIDELDEERTERAKAKEHVVEKRAAAFGFFEQSQSSDGFRLDGMIGLGGLGPKAFTVDYETQRIWLAP